MTETLKLTILTPERRLLSNFDVDSVTVTGSEGQIQILPGHASMLGVLETGLFSYQQQRQEMVSGFISTGFFEVNDNQVTLTCETLELQNEIDHNRARQAQLKAEKILQEASLESSQFKKYQLKLQRALIRQQLTTKSQ
ncbi:MAG: ATP synthase F1 subunit epsilon [Deltaproteobacteria bacterium]|nr:ATP synthase F1 subunit epsilon [Deltaproteobacteria bacterium]MBI4926089.1 ATP synthase F1 subunit epsilon [Bdellovibrio sp.]